MQVDCERGLQMRHRGFLKHGTGFTEAQLDLALVMCAYVYDGTKYVYLQEVQNDIPASVTIGNYL